ncbi:MAG: YdcF family protein [Fibrobacterota bacterium]
MIISVFSIASFHFFATPVLAVLENVHPPGRADSLDSISYIIVLGSGNRFKNGLPPTAVTSETAMMRLTEGLRLGRLYPEAKVILSGGAVFGDRSCASVMLDAAVSLGFDSSKFILSDQSLDTHEESVNISKIVGNKNCILVTSASHMPRSAGLFKKQGVIFNPSPTDFQAVRAIRLNPHHFFPSSKNLSKLKLAVHEFAGIIWSKLNGQI